MALARLRLARETTYGTVYKARCDGLLCAAKIMHPELAAEEATIAPERRHRLPMMRFEAECRLLSAIRHPNIVQYLGVCEDVDPHTSLPVAVLLMELLDGNLTNLLGKHEKTLPFHTQIDICHDISLALAFLHSNGIIHRDLSSNNVLMIRDQRAKITDLGMARLFSRPNSLTKNPGTQAYMPPEAGDVPDYHTGIDCFSFGVLIIQIVTLVYPEPGKEFIQVKTGKNLHKRVPEVERRQNHIELIEASHPLLPLALECIRNDSNLRPCADELCSRLDKLHESEHYIESVRVCNPVRIIAELKELSREMKQKHEEQVSLLESNHSEAIERIKEQSQTDIQQLQRTHSEKTEELETQHVKEVDYLQQVIKSTEDKMKFLEHNHNHHIVELKQKSEKAVEEWKQKYEAMAKETKILRKRIETLEGRAVKSKPKETATVKLMRRGSSATTWKLWDNHRAPLPVYRDDSESVYCNDTLYIRPGSRRSIMAYHPRLNKWREMPKCPHKYATLAHVNNTVLVIGGRTDTLDYTYLNEIFYLTDKEGECRWETALFHMPTKRCSAMAVTAGTSLIVAGGEGKECCLRKVEVMDIDTCSWSTATDLPEPLIFSSTTLCGGVVYFFGGEVGYHGVEKSSMFSCSLQDLLKSRTKTSRDRKRKMSEPLVNIWKESAGPPVSQSACITFQGQVLSIGGKGSDKMPTSAVYVLNADTASWTNAGYLTTPRSKCFAVVLPGDEIMHSEEVLVVGGKTSSGKTDTLEIGTLNCVGTTS